MKRRFFLQILGAGSVGLLLPCPVSATSLRSGNYVSLRCLGDIPGRARYLDGRTANETVGLAPTTEPPFTGTRWEVRLYPALIDEGTNLNPVRE